jgi:hypothetical protein
VANSTCSWKSLKSCRVRITPFPVSTTPSFIAQDAAAPSAPCQALRSLPFPISVVASEGAPVDAIAPGVTMRGCGRVPSWMCHFPLGCIGVSS